MFNPNVHYYIGTGDKCGFYTLHRVEENSASVYGFRDEYIQNLSTDFDKAYEKALELTGTGTYLDAEPFELDEIGRMRGEERWKMILKFKDPLILPFGKWHGQCLHDVLGVHDDSADYIWWMVNAICKEHSRKTENIPFMVAALLELDDMGIEDPAVVREREYEERKRIDAELDANAQPVPETKERLQITGTVLTTKWVDSMYDDVLKMLIRTEDGYKLWGSVPSGLDKEVERGMKITFMCRVEQSDDDPIFGYFKRPTKAQLIEDFE